jgi:hypothetical protein
VLCPFGVDLSRSERERELLLLKTNPTEREKHLSAAGFAGVIQRIGQ